MLLDDNSPPQSSSWSRRRILVSCCAVAATLTVAGCKRKTFSPSPARIPLAPDGSMHPSAGDRCPMCAMDAFEHKQWVGAIELDNGTTWYLCSARCTFGTALQSERFLGVAKNRIRRVRVQNYLQPDKSIPADDAFYVVDSDVASPMGAALLAVSSADDASVVVRRHGGRILRRSDISIDLLKSLKSHGKSHESGQDRAHP